MEIEASGQSQRCERMLAELGHQVWIADAAKIRAGSERKQKTGRRDAELLLRLLGENRFPRIWVHAAADGIKRRSIAERTRGQRGFGGRPGITLRSRTARPTPDARIAALGMRRTAGKQHKQERSKFE